MSIQGKNTRNRLSFSCSNQRKQPSREGSITVEQEVFNKQGSPILQSDVSDKQTNDQRKDSTDLKQQITFTEKQKSLVRRTSDTETRYTNYSLAF